MRSSTPRPRRLAAGASNPWRSKTSISCTGKRNGQPLAFTAAPSARSRRCSRKRSPHLQPLPLEPFRTFTEVTRTVQDDTTVQVDNASYAARPAAIGKVLVRIYEHEIEIRDLHTLALMRTPCARLAHRIAAAARCRASVQPLAPDAPPPLAGRSHRCPHPRALSVAVRHARRVGQRSMWGIVGVVPALSARIVEQACHWPWPATCAPPSSARARRAAPRAGPCPPGSTTSSPGAELTPHPAARAHPPRLEYAEFFARSAQSTPSHPPRRITHEHDHARDRTRSSSCACRALRATLETRILQAQAANLAFLETFSADPAR